MNTLVIVIVVAMVIIGIRLVMHAHSGKAATKSASSCVVPADKAEAFAIGMHPGEDGVPVMYTLVTCRHCVHLKNFLTTHGIEHHVVFVDDFNGQARTDMMATLRGYNPRGSFPTLVLPGGRTITGFRETQVREAFGLPIQD